MNVKKFIGILLSAIMLLGMIAVPSMAYDGTSYYWSFDDISNADGIKATTPDADGSISNVTAISRPLDGDEDNMAVRIDGEKNAVTNIDSGHNIWNQSIDKTLDGLSVLSFDFMVPSSASSEYTRLIDLRFALSDGTTEKDVARVLTLDCDNDGTQSSDKNWESFAVKTASAGASGFSDVRTSTAVVGEAEGDIWHNIQIIIDPDDASGKWILTRNCDATNPDNVSIYEGAFYTANQTPLAKECIKVTRLKVTTQNTGTQVCVDNMTFKEIQSEFDLVSASPVKDSTDVALQPEISFTFNNAVASSNMKIGNETVEFTKSNNDKTISYIPSQKLESGVEYNVSGIVTDSEGLIYKIDHSFTTLSYDGVSTIDSDLNEYKYTFDNDDIGYSAITNNPIDTENGYAEFSPSFKNDAGWQVAQWRMWSWNDRQKMKGNYNVSFDIKLSAPSDASSWEQGSDRAAMQLVLATDSGNNANVSTTWLMDIEWDSAGSASGGSWKPGFETAPKIYEWIYTDVAPDTWQTVSFDLYPGEGIIEAINGDELIRVPLVKSNGDAVSGYDSSFYDIRFRNNINSATMTIDNFELKQPVAMDNARFESSDGVPLTDSEGNLRENADFANGAYYTVDIINGSAIARTVSLAVCEYNSGELVQLSFEDYTIPANGTLNMRNGFASVIDGSTVKAFFLNSDGISPFRANAIKAMEITINE